MRDPAQVVKDLLVSGGIGAFNSNTGWSICIGEPRVDPDTIILVNLVGGPSPYPHLLLNFPSVQVLVRGAKSGYVAGMAKANEIVNFLLGMSSTTDTISGDVYRSCNQIGETAYMGQDDNTRPMISMNFSFIVEPAPEAGSHRISIT